MQGVAEDWARLARERSPDLQVALAGGTKLSAEGFQALLAGRANCATFVREPFASELAAFKARFGYEPTLIPVAGGSYATPSGTHAIAIYVNAANPIAGLDLAQLDAILSKERRRGASDAIVTWGQLGLAGEWAGRPIHVYGMLRRRATGDPPGVVNFMIRRVLLGGDVRDDVREQTDRPGESALQGIVNRIAEDPAGIGYSGFGFARPGVRALPLAEAPGRPFVKGTSKSVRQARYPLSRSIYILFDRPPGRPISEPLRRFLETALSAEGQAALTRDRMGFLPLPPDRLAAARSALE